MIIFDTIRVLVIANQICSTVWVKTIEAWQAHFKPKQITVTTVSSSWCTDTTFATADNFAYTYV